MNRAFKIRNWNQFQHFKDRRPPWIKLYKYLLDDMEWHALSGDSAKVLVMLWLVASEDEGYLPDENILSFRLRMSKKQLQKALNDVKQWVTAINNGTNRDDITLISEGYQNDALEKRREEKREKRNHIDIPPPPPPENLNNEAWKIWCEYRREVKKPIKTPSILEAQKKLANYGDDQMAVVNQSIANGWQGLFDLKDKKQIEEQDSAYI